MRRLFYFFVLWFINSFFRLVYRHKVFGQENVGATGGAIIASNHVSFYDAPIVAISWTGEIHFMARDTLFKNPFLGTLIRWCNSHPVVRGRHNTSLFRTIEEVIGQGGQILVFPEGTRSRDGGISTAKSGIGLLALRMACPVIPVYVHGTHEIWGKGRKLPRLSGRTACVIGRPIMPAKFAAMDNKKEAQEAFSHEVMLNIADLRAWYLKKTKT